MTRGSRASMFVTVGLAGFAVQVAALAALTARAGLGVVPATLAAVELAILHNFMWHERWTWGDRAERDPAGWWKRLALFHASNGALSLGANLAVTAVLVSWAGTPLLVANALAVGAGAVANFLAADRLVFRFGKEVPA